MYFFEFIFLARDWKKDRATLVKNLETAKNDNGPMWLLVFPEGTVITEGTKAKSQAYCKKMDIPDDPQNVLVPKTTGLFHMLRCLDSRAEYLYDFTIGYSGLKQGDIPYDAYSPSTVFFKGDGPKSIHMHVDRFKIRDIPGLASRAYNPDEKTDPAFEKWLRERFLAKDALMNSFYENGKFPDGDEGLRQTLHIDPAYQDWISILGLIFSSAVSLSWLLL